MVNRWRAVWLAAATACTAGAQDGLPAATVLGPSDEIVVRALHVDEFPATPIRVSGDGGVTLPIVGRVVVAGKTTVEVETAIAERLRPYVLDPQVSVFVTGFHSEPVSVLGAVRNPGVYQVQGRKTLAEMLSLAGGFDAMAGATIKITRPLQGEAEASQGYTVLEVSVASILNADDPKRNIEVKARDVITVPRAEMIYVVGQVQKAGGFVLSEAKGASVLQAVSLAGGFDRTASPQNARLLKASKDGTADRVEMAVNLKNILAGSAADVPMAAGDILFVPSSAPKRAALRAVEAAIQMGTGIVIWRR